MFVAAHVCDIEYGTLWDPVFKGSKDFGPAEVRHHSAVLY